MVFKFSQRPNSIVSGLARLWFRENDENLFTQKNEAKNSVSLMNITL
jgi:hypothetical protein